MTQPDDRMASDVAYHVTSAANRESIDEAGLDWRLLGAAPGIAGSTEPEIAGVFLARDVSEVCFFLRFPSSAPHDVWRVDVAGLHVSENEEGWLFSPEPISRDRLDRVDPPSPPAHDG